MANTQHAGLTGTNLHEAFHYVDASDPGAVGAGLYWLDTSTTPYELKRRNATDDGWITVGASGGGGGSLFTVGNYADSRPASPNAGDTFIPKDGYWQEIYHDGIWNPYRDGFLLTKPPTSGWTALNSPTTFDTDQGALYLQGIQNATFQVRGEYRTAPSPPYTITVCLLPVLPDANAQCGIGWRDSSTQELITWGPGIASAGTYAIRVAYTWVDHDSLSDSFVNASMPQALIAPVWLSITDDNTDIIMKWLPSGPNQAGITVVTQARTGFLNPDQLLIAVAPGSVLPAAMTVLSWKQT
jgi:hypothetical protein